MLKNTPQPLMLRGYTLTCSGFTLPKAHTRTFNLTDSCKRVKAEVWFDAEAEHLGISVRLHRMG